MNHVQSRRQWILDAVGGAGVFWIVAAEPDRSQAQTGSKPISVRIVDKAGYDKILTANMGKVIVVDCWATWCVPCRKAFPKTVELGKRYADQGVIVVSLCFDDPIRGEVPETVKKFLVLQDAQFENLLSSLEISAEGATAFAIEEGALPHFKVYGKNGKIFKTFNSGEDLEFNHEDIENAVKAALAAK